MQHFCALVLALPAALHAGLCRQLRAPLLWRRRRSFVRPYAARSFVQGRSSCAADPLAEALDREERAAPRTVRGAVAVLGSRTARLASCSLSSLHQPVELFQLLRPPTDLQQWPPTRPATARPRPTTTRSPSEHEPLSLLLLVLLSLTIRLRAQAQVPRRPRGCRLPPASRHVRGSHHGALPARPLQDVVRLALGGVPHSRRRPQGPPLDRPVRTPLGSLRARAATDPVLCAQVLHRGRA